MTRRHESASPSIALIVLAFIAAFPVIAAAQDLGDCGCPDVRAMRDRWCSARAARSEYQRIVSYFNSETKKTGQTRMYSLADKKMINQSCVQEAINRVSDRGVAKATAITQENLPTQSPFMEDCRVEVTSENHTACLKQVVQAHEALHSQACVNRNKAGGVISLVLQGDIRALLGDTKYTMTSAQFASEEAASYATEMQLLAAKWQTLQQRCAARFFEAELSDPSTVGQNLWDNAKPDSDGKRKYRMYDLTGDPCPSRPPPPTSECTLR